MSSAFGATFGARRKYLSMSLGFADPARSRRKSSAARKEPTFSATAARDELVQRYAIGGSQFCGCLLHRCGKFQWISVLAHFLILWSMTLGVITSISKSPAAGQKSRTLCVTMDEARPFTAASSTNSSAGSARRRTTQLLPSGRSLTKVDSFLLDNSGALRAVWREVATRCAKRPPRCDPLRVFSESAPRTRWPGVRHRRIVRRALAPSPARARRSCSPPWP